MPRVASSAALFLLLLPAAWAQAVRLEPGVARRFSIAPQAQPLVITGIAVSVPPGTIRLTIDLEPDALSNDLSLFARFDQDVAIQGNTVVAADYSAQTPGTGREQIVITSASAPALQTGTYYVAIGVVTLGVPITGSITATLTSGGNTGTYIISSFDSDTDGWTRNFPGSALPGASLGDPSAVLDWFGAGGNPGGYLTLNDPENVLRQEFVVAPTKFLGNLAALVNPRLDFDYRHISGPDASYVLIVRILGSGSAFEWRSSEPPGSAWTHYRAPLNATAWRQISGIANFALMLSNVQRIEISMDQAVGPESNGLDNFALTSDPPLGPPRTTPAAPVISRFDTDSEGWGRNYPPVGIPGASVGDSGSTLAWTVDSGRPGGAITLTEPGAGADDFFVAPAKFLGNLAGIPNPRLEFDYRHLASPPGVTQVVVRLLGAGAAFRWSGLSPQPTYQHYLIPLTEAFFVREFGGATFAQVLAAVERLEISADQSDAEESDSLDNVALLSSPTPPLQPSLSLAPTPLSFTGSVGDPNPPSQTLVISSTADAGGLGGGVSWKATIDPPAPWLTLSATGGATPSRITVSVNVANLGPGNYAATITITATGAANSPQSVTVSLAVAGPAAPVPRITAGGIGNAAFAGARLSAGALGTLYGSNLGPGEGGALGFLPGTRMLPTNFLGVRVLVRDVAGAPIAEAPLLYVSRSQINFQMPWEAAGRSSVVLVVDNNGLLSAPETIPLAPVAPGLFTFGVNRAAAQNPDFSTNSPTNAVPRGGFLIAYLTGQGPLSVPVPTGQAAPASPLAEVTSTATAAIGGVPAQILFVGLTPGLVGVAQANIAVPSSVPAGDQSLVITIAGQPANSALVSIR